MSNWIPPARGTSMTDASPKFDTRECHERFEAQARDNLQRAIEKLG